MSIYLRKLADSWTRKAIKDSSPGSIICFYGLSWLLILLLQAPIKTRISDEELAASLPKVCWGLCLCEVSQVTSIINLVLSSLFFFPQFNIEEILQKKMVSKEKNTARPQLKAMKEKLAKDGIVYGTDRKLLMRTLTNFLYYDHVKWVALYSCQLFLYCWQSTPVLMWHLSTLYHCLVAVM